MELKKREKDIERIIEKWSKLSDIQTKLSTSSSGLTFRCGNADAGTGSEVLGKGNGYLEIALEQAESARASLADETIALQRLIMNVANRLQSVLHELRCLISPCVEEVRLQPQASNSLLTLVLARNNIAQRIVLPRTSQRGQ